MFPWQQKKCKHSITQKLEQDRHAVSPVFISMHDAPFQVYYIQNLTITYPQHTLQKPQGVINLRQPLKYKSNRYGEIGRV
jgi:hypothetical protein